MTKLKKATGKAKKPVVTSACWQPLHSAEVTKPGGTLIAWLLFEAGQRGQLVKELATELGVTAGYLSQLRTGHRHVKHISHEFEEACGRYLGVPTILVKIAAGKIKLSDFLRAEASEENFLDIGLRRIQADPMVSGYLPPEAFSAHPAVKRFILLCYQEASGCEIYNACALPTMMHHLKGAVAVQNEREDAIADFLAEANGTAVSSATAS